MKLLRILFVLGSVAALSACGSTQPGAAVVIGDRTISMNRVDTVAELYCASVLLSNNQNARSVDNAALRKQAALDLARQMVAAQYVSQEDIAIDPELASVSNDDEKATREAFGAKGDDAVELLTDQQLLYAQEVAIGAAQTGQTANDDIVEQLQVKGAETVLEQVEGAGVEFAPRVDGAESGGSLSVAADSDSAGPSQDAYTQSVAAGPVGCSGP